MAEEPTGEDAAPQARTPAVAAGVVVLAVLALAFVAVSGYFGYTHRQAAQEAQQRSEILEAARQGVVNLTTMDFERADEDVQKVLDGSAGEFRDEFEARSKDLIAVMQEAKVKSQGRCARLRSRRRTATPRTCSSRSRRRCPMRAARPRSRAVSGCG